MCLIGRPIPRMIYHYIRNVFSHWLRPSSAMDRKHAYRQTSNISQTLEDNNIFDHSDVFGASPIGAAPTSSSFSILTPDFNGFDKDNCKTRRETFKCLDCLCLILEVWR